MLTVSPVSYLITILQREQVAQVRGRSIYVVTDVTLIPLSSQSEASNAIDQAKKSLKKPRQHAAQSPDSDTSDDASQQEDNDQVSLTSSGSSTQEDVFSVPKSSAARSTGGVAEDVIEKKGQYGRFAERWFSKKGWTTDRRMAQGMSIDSVERLRTSEGQAMGLSDLQLKSAVAATALERAESSDWISKLEVPNRASGSDTSGRLPANVANIPKLLRTTRMLLTSRSFFFSYDIDITRSLATSDLEVSGIPLHRSADSLVSHRVTSIRMGQLLGLMICSSIFGTDI